MKALTLAEMQAFLQRRIDEDETTKQEIKYLVDELNGYDCDVKLHPDFTIIKASKYTVHK